MSIIISASRIDHYIHVLHRSEYSVTPASLALIDELFSIVQAVKPCGDDERRELWLTADRGAFEEFQGFDEMTEEEQAECREEYESWWAKEYPQETVWYHFVTVEHDSFRAMALGQQIILQLDSRQAGSVAEYGLDISPLMSWIIDAAKACVEKLRDGTYNEYVRSNLPYRHRTGTIVRGKYWDILPDAKESELDGITESEINEFVRLIARQTNDVPPVARMKEMTAARFFELCALGYKANAYAGVQTLSPMELYTKHADGRDDGLREIDQHSPEAFDAWLHDRKRFGGHPWEVCRGGNSTHISLYCAGDSAQGYYFTLAGNAWTRTVETIKFYIALVKNGIPVHLMDGCELAARVLGTEKIGIVPHGVFPAYCSTYFPNEKIIDYMNIPLDMEQLFADQAVWQEIPEQYLNNKA